MDPKQLKRLRDHWERVLEREGLGDIEKGGMLRVYHDSRLLTKETFHPDQNQAKETYYELAAAFLHSYSFESRLEKRIWKMHSQGMSWRTIAQKIGQPLNHTRIGRRIQRLRQAMLGKASSGKTSLP